MIVADAAEARGVLDDLAALSSYSGQPPELRDLCEDVTQSVVAQAFPGAVVPSLDHAGAMYVNIAVPSVGDWRRLKPVLLAFAGPTMTGFDGVPGPFPPGDPTAPILMATNPAVTAVMPLSQDPKLRAQALRAIIRARATLERAPDLQRAAPVPTSWLLARFQDYLNVGRRDAAMALLERLRSELRLDALNLKFLEVQLYAGFADWSAILAIPEFPSLCRARRTSAVTVFLLEALYQGYLAQAFDAQEISDLRTRYADAVRDLAHPMLLVPGPTGLTPGGARIYALEASFAPSRTDLAPFLAGRDDLGWLAEALPPKAPAEPDPAPVPATPLDAARETLLEVEAFADNDRVATALAYLAQLTPQERARLDAAHPFARIVADIAPLLQIDLPASWPAWLARAAEPDFTSALEVAHRGAEEWPIDMAIGDPVAVQALINALDQAQNISLAAERSSQALPYIVSWLKRDPDFPRPALSPLYASLLTLFALGNSRGHQIFDSSQALISALLAGGLDQKSYTALIADVNEIAGDGFGVDSIYWVLEMVEAFMNAPAPDANRREAFLHSILARIDPLFGRLTSLQRRAVEILCAELGWPIDRLGIDIGLMKVDGFAARLEGLRIAIYSLTETASRQAKLALEALNSNVVVEINADHGGTGQLRALSKNADLFIITWLSAKHAATDFIRAHRGDLPLIYAQGKGFSSILRALEDHLTPRN